jgi:hypothetical protein
MLTRRTIFASLLFGVAGAGQAEAQSGRRSGSSGPRTYGGTGSNPYSHGRSGYVRRDSGTYVPPHRATNPNSTRRDNYEARGNYNPYNGRTGRRLVDR